MTTTYGVGGFIRRGLPCFDNRDLDAGLGEDAGNNPAVTSIVAWPRKNDGAVPEALGIAARDLCCGDCAGAAHQHA